MNDIFIDCDTRIKKYAEIQSSLLSLKPNSTDAELDNIISQIPPEFLSSTEDLMILCQLFSHYGKYINHSIRGNVIKLFERIMDPIRNFLKDESNFFLIIFDGILYFKLIFYEEGLISIQNIIDISMQDQSCLYAEYFMPEIIEKEPEIFEKEIKQKLKCPCTPEYINEFKEKRKKYIKWVRDSSDYNDSFYQEIDSNALRISIKTDDVHSFQKYLSNSNMSVNSEIDELIFENYLIWPRKICLIELAINYDAINIFKFLIMNDVDLTKINFNSVILRNNEMIHIIETNVNQIFSKFSLLNSIGCWNNDMTEYSLNNSNFDFLEKSDVDIVNDQMGTTILYYTCYSFNFIFFDSIYLPFLRNNDRFVNENINELICKTTCDLSCFFMRNFMKHPLFDVNYFSKEKNNISLLKKCLIECNTTAFILLFQYPELICKRNTKEISFFQFACAKFSDLKIIKLLIKDGDISINAGNKATRTSAFGLAVYFGNFYAIELIIDFLFESEKYNFLNYLTMCSKKNHLYTMKIIMKKMLEKFDDQQLNRLKYLTTTDSKIKKIYDELQSNE